MSYSAQISFKEIEAEDIHEFFQAYKAEVLSHLDDIAKDNYIFCPYVKCSYENFMDACEDEALKYESESWFFRLFSYRWFYLKEEKLLGVYGVSDCVNHLFDGTVYFQNSTDQDYEREWWQGITAFEKIYDKWLNASEEEIKSSPYYYDYCTDDENYERRTLAYQEIWSKCSDSLDDDDSVVMLSLFDYWSSLKYKTQFLKKCWELAQKEK